MIFALDETMQEFNVACQLRIIASKEDDAAIPVRESRPLNIYDCFYYPAQNVLGVRSGVPLTLNGYAYMHIIIITVTYRECVGFTWSKEKWTLLLFFCLPLALFIPADMSYVPRSNTDANLPPAMMAMDLMQVIHRLYILAIGGVTRDIVVTTTFSIVHSSADILGNYWRLAV
jgi:hypothetical protein